MTIEEMKQALINEVYDWDGDTLVGFAMDTIAAELEQDSEDTIKAKWEVSFGRLLPEDEE